MKTNVGVIDRTLRGLVGIILMFLAYKGSIGLWGWLGAVPLATGLAGWCPLYSAVGWNTCVVKKST